MNISTLRARDDFLDRKIKAVKVLAMQKHCGNPDFIRHFQLGFSKRDQEFESPAKNILTM
jgi:hypothetical protein